ncbi:DUF6318 family protein [Xylanimonas ulmi]|uniref:DUF6318 domain-containing protein n=1 Tax=Xylanimonas ulmi TaxID=228973 RepID=A0A4Q7LZB7_9MICO|nr:DUF6318 family protein [Xylanibacterium ulmi]RZS60294.1 hypothetical protein EV386_0546 [Xylanibacterium ulmi]
MLAAVAMMVAAGCTSDAGTPLAGPHSSAPASASAPEPSPTPSRVVVKPTRPDAMDDDGPAGAEAAAVYFLALDPYMQATGDTAEFEAMSHDVCTFCSARIDQAKMIMEMGDVFTGGEIVVDILHTYRQDVPTGIWPIDIEVREERSTIMTPDGVLAFENDAGTNLARVEVARREGRWVVINVANAPGQ